MKMGYSFWDDNLLSYSLLVVFMGLIISYHSIDLATHEPHHLKSKFKYSKTKFLYQFLISFLILTAAFIFYFYNPKTAIKLE